MDSTFKAAAAGQLQNTTKDQEKQPQLAAPPHLMEEHSAAKILHVTVGAA
jgi:hypothetical protein